MKMPRLTLLVAALVAAFATDVGALQVDFGAVTPPSVMPGSALAVPIMLSGVPADLDWLSLDVSYDPAVLSYDWLPNGLAPTFAGGSGAQTDVVPGLVNVQVPYASFAGLGGAFELTSLSFFGLAPGRSAISFAAGFASAGGLDFIPTLGPSARASVPEPGSLLLLVTGLAGLLGYGRSRNRIQSPRRPA